MKKKTPLWKRWWLWLVVVLFISINLLVTNNNQNQEENPSNDIRISDSNISTH